jgi:hypothetical protein
MNLDQGLNSGRNEGENFGLNAANRMVDYDKQEIEPGEQSEGASEMQEEVKYEFGRIESCFNGPFNNLISSTRYFWIAAGFALALYAGMRV